MKPIGLDAWYFYPFGTFDNISINEFPTERLYQLGPYVLFHFDQEPIVLNQSWKVYDHTSHQRWSGKVCRILANSEHSDVKKKVCQQHSMLDWYFFYHGFAALYWFQDSQYVHQVQDFTKSFCSFNHIVRNKRAYRMALTARLLDMDIDINGLVSFHGSSEDCADEVRYEHSLLSQDQKQLIERHLCSNQQLPLMIDINEVDGDHSAHYGHREHKLWQSFFLHVVNETIFYDPKLHLTEKVFKPIVSLRPFILVGAPGNLRYLRGYGFKTFEPWIDESYDDETDPDQRLDLIAREVQKIYAKPLSDLRQIYAEMLPILEYNKRHFFREFRYRITDELVNNFDQCLRIWGNGRVDGRELPLLQNAAAVKDILLR